MSSKKLVNFGYYKPVPSSGEYHANSADLAKLLHNAIGLDKTMTRTKRLTANAADMKKVRQIFPKKQKNSQN